MKFSIIIVTFNRKKALTECLQSICAQSLKIPHEVIIILNGDIGYLEKYKSNFRQFNFIHIPQTTSANARNIAIKKAHGEYILFLEDDCILPSNYFQNISFEQDWDVLGGPDQTPLHASSLQTLIGRALASPLCMGPAFKRHSRNSIYDNNATEESFVICNLWFRKNLFNDEGFQFNKCLFRNEEHFLLIEMAKKNKVFHYNPELFVYHQRQPNIEKLGAAIIQSGKCRASTFFLEPKKSEMIYFSPMIFTVCFFFMIFHPNIFFLTSILLYTLSVLVYGMITSRRFSLSLVFLHCFILFCYNIGLLKGSWMNLGTFYKNFKTDNSLINEPSGK
ncbi:MAG: glycosyltransferase [Bacteriovorax sp.]|nr:glycosyltransferase [Bacteriovorax sp.]